MEFGVDGDESRVSEDWPFELRKLVETSELTVFEFDEDEAYFALADDGLNFLPQAGMTVDDLMLQQAGAKWIGARDPIDLSVVRLGDPSAPSGVERLLAQALGSATVPGEAVNILEGLFLSEPATYLALFGKSGEQEAVIAGCPTLLRSFRTLSSGIVLASAGMGRWSMAEAPRRMTGSP